MRGLGQGAVNTLGAAFALLLAMGLPLAFRQSKGSIEHPLPDAVESAQPPARQSLEQGLLQRPLSVREEQGQQQLQDAHGRWIPLRRYGRIASGSTLSDALLLEFASPQRIVSFSRYSQDNERTRHRYLGKPLLDPLEELERLLELKPDLVLISTSNSPAKLERLEREGALVFDLGSAQGVRTFVHNAKAIAALLGVPELGSDYVWRFVERLKAVSRGRTGAANKTGMYLALYGKQLYSGGPRTSYDDVLRYAGVKNVVDVPGWPLLNSEQVLAWDPDLIVTAAGMAAKVCSDAGLSSLRACREGAWVEVSKALLSDAGSGMLEATESIHQQVYGKE